MFMVLVKKIEFIVPYIFNCLKEKKEIQLNRPFDLRDFVFVNDVCDAIVKVIYEKILLLKFITLVQEKFYK